MAAVIFLGYSCDTSGEIIPSESRSNNKWELSSGYIKTGLKRTAYRIDSGSPEAYELVKTLVNAKTDAELCAIVMRYGHVGPFSRKRREFALSSINDMRRLVESLRRVAKQAQEREFSKIAMPDLFWPQGKRQSMDFRFYLIPPTFSPVFYTKNLFVFAWREIVVLALGGRAPTMCASCSDFIPSQMRQNAKFCCGKCRTAYHRKTTIERQYLGSFAAEAPQ